MADLSPPLIERVTGFQERALHLQVKRQELLASNIANADTPNFRAKDLDFRSALVSAMEGRGAQPVTLARTAEGHLAGLPAGAGGGQFVFERIAKTPGVDGNTVDMDVERADFAANAMQYESSLTFINGMFKSMQLAISGQ